MSALLPHDSIHRATARERAVTFHLVDDDPDVRRALRSLLQRFDDPIRAYDSAEQFLAAYDPVLPQVLVLDIVLPGMTGLELLTTLARRSELLPTLVLSAGADVERVVTAMQSGAVGFLAKPPDPQRFLEYVERLLERAEPMAAERTTLRWLQACEQRLTPREREAFAQLARGMSTKQVAHALGTSTRTAHIHRTNVLAKFGTESPFDLVQIAERLRQAEQRKREFRAS
jgi:FixJ family two-component response regulator